MPAISPKTSIFSYAQATTVVFFSLTYIIVFTYFSWMKYATFHTGSPDLAIYVSHVWSIQKGTFVNSILANNLVWSDHLIPILLVPSLLSFLFPIAPLLLFIQSLALGLSSLLLYRVASRHVNQWVAVTLSLAFLLHPAISNANLFEFHTTTFAVPFLILFLDALDQDKTKRAVCFLLLAIFAREEVAGIMLLWGLLLTRRNMRLGLSLAIGAIAWTVLAVVLKMDNPMPWSVLAQSLPKQQSTLAWHSISSKFTTLTVLFLGFAGFSMARKSILLLFAIPFLYFFVSSYEPLSKIEYQYWCMFVPFLAVASIPAFLKVWNVAGMRIGTPHKLIALMICSIAMHYFFSLAPWASKGSYGTYQSDVYSAEAKTILSMIKPRESVAAPDAILSHLADRSNAHRGVRFDVQALVMEQRPPKMIGELQERYRARLDKIRNAAENNLKSGKYYFAYRGKKLVLMKQH